MNTSISATRLDDELVEAFSLDAALSQQEEGAVVSLLLERGDGVFADLLEYLVSLRLDPIEARRRWKEILTHKYLMSERLGRNVGIRVAALDYFSNILHDMTRPRIVDPHALDRLVADANTDPLTGLPNRRFFRERLQSEATRCRRYGGEFCLALFDLDNFKKVNDTMGHAVGDAVLQEAAAAIRASIRETDVAARWGGEEFILLMPETSKREGRVVAERIRERIRTSSVSVPGQTVSGGVAAFPEDGMNDDDLFTFADRALYRAKAEGKNLISLAPLERRAAARRDGEWPARIEIQHWDDSEIRITAANIGAGGMLFRWNERFPLRSGVRGEICNEEECMEFHGSVARVEEICSDQYEIAVAFHQIDEERHARLLSLLD